MKKILIMLGVITVLVMGAWYYWWNIAQRPIPKNLNVIAQRESIDPSTFTREEAFQKLAVLEAVSKIKFDTILHLASTSTAFIPQDAALFVLPGPGEAVMVKKGTSQKGTELYSISFFVEYAMPDNHMRFFRLAHPDTYKLVHGARNELASLIELETSSHQIRISQLAVSENRTEVIIYVQPKQ